MADLQAMFVAMKFTEVITYIQSGNVVFKAPKAADDMALANEIEAAIHKKFQLNVPVIIRTILEMEQAIAVNPMIKQDGIDVERLHITFLAEAPSRDALEQIKKYDYPPDVFFIHNKEVYLYCPNGYGNTKLSNTFFENKLKVKATTRNWKTVNKLVELGTGKSMTHGS
jgi:uncharacterized protein (DUF1697 family)